MDPVELAVAKVEARYVFDYNANTCFQNVWLKSQLRKKLSEGVWGDLGYVSQEFPGESYAMLRVRYLAPFLLVSPNTWEKSDGAEAAALVRQAELESAESKSSEASQSAQVTAGVSEHSSTERKRKASKASQSSKALPSKASLAKASLEKAAEEDLALEEAVKEVEEAKQAQVAAAQARAVEERVKVERLERAREIQRAAFVAAKAKEVAAIARDEAKKALAEAKLKADNDLEAMVNQLKFFPQLAGVSSIPLNLAQYSFLFCCMMRQSLMMNVILCLQHWTSVANLPPYETFGKLFTTTEQSTGMRLSPTPNPPMYMESSKMTLGAQLVVQTTRNIVGIVLDLRNLVLRGLEDDDHTAEFHGRFQVLYSICNQRQFSMSLIEAISSLGESPALFDLYRAVQMFENFCAGSDFVVFRQCFPLPQLPPMPYEKMTNKTAAQTRDFFLNIGMSPTLSDEMAIAQRRKDQFLGSSREEEWYAYLQSITQPGNIFQATRLLWSASFKTVCKWVKEPPSLASLESTSTFEELLPKWFGAHSTTRLEFTAAEDNDTQDLNEYILACGLDVGCEDPQQQILAFLLSQGKDSPLSSWSTTREKLPSLVLPFSVTIQEVRNHAYMIYTPSNTDSPLTHTLRRDGSWCVQFTKRSHSFAFTQSCWMLPQHTI